MIKGIIASLLWAGGFFAVTVLMTGCARGHAIYGEFGYKQVDEYESRQKTYAKPLPLKCYVWSFEGCNGQQAPVNNGGMVEGS